MVGKGGCLGGDEPAVWGLDKGDDAADSASVDDCATLLGELERWAGQRSGGRRCAGNKEALRSQQQNQLPAVAPEEREGMVQGVAPCNSWPRFPRRSP